MLFQVRAGYVVHDTKFIEVNNRIVEQTKTYWEGDVADFDAETAFAHAHKLEPKDKEATKWLATTFPTLPSAPEAVAGDSTGAITALNKQISDLTALVAQLASLQAASSVPAAQTGEQTAPAAEGATV